MGGGEGELCTGAGRSEMPDRDQCDGLPMLKGGGVWKMQYNM